MTDSFIFINNFGNPPWVEECDENNLLRLAVKRCDDRGCGAWSPIWSHYCLKHTFPLLGDRDLVDREEPPDKGHPGDELPPDVHDKVARLL